MDIVHILDQREICKDLSFSGHLPDVRARAVHFLEDARQLVVAYLNHGVV